MKTAKMINKIELDRCKPGWQHEVLVRFRWGISRGNQTQGYRTCAIYVNNIRFGGCNGGGYDMRGTATGMMVERLFADELTAIKRSFSALSFIDPTFDPGKAVALGGDGRTVAEREATGDSVGLERYQAAMSASSPVPTATHRVPSIDGGHGFDQVCRILDAIGYTLKQRKGEIYVLTKKED